VILSLAASGLLVIFSSRFRARALPTRIFVPEQFGREAEDELVEPTEKVASARSSRSRLEKKDSPAPNATPGKGPTAVQPLAASTAVGRRLVENIDNAMKEIEERSIQRQERIALWVGIAIVAGFVLWLVLSRLR
jgi:hypothetical protein